MLDIGKQEQGIERNGIDAWNMAGSTKGHRATDDDYDDYYIITELI